MAMDKIAKYDHKIAALELDEAVVGFLLVKADRYRSKRSLLRPFAQRKWKDALEWLVIWCDLGGTSGAGYDDGIELEVSEMLRDFAEGEFVLRAVTYSVRWLEGDERELVSREFFDGE